MFTVYLSISAEVSVDVVSEMWIDFPRIVVRFKTLQCFSSWTPYRRQAVDLVYTAQFVSVRVG